MSDHQDLLAAYDAAVEALAAAPHDLRLKHRAVLMLARAGATQHARREYVALGLDHVTDDEDVLALGGRILKDLCLTQRGEQRRKLAALSAAKYAQAYGLHQGYYPGINTATLFLLAGEVQKAKSLAAAVLQKTKALPRTFGEEAYYITATAAEAALLLGDVAQANTTLAAAIACDAQNIPARATTLRQFAVICASLGHDTAWLDAHRPPPAIFYSGHMFRDDGPAPETQALTNKLHDALNALNPSAGYGALAAGVDILVAEYLVARGAQVHVVLPFAEDHFIAQSVAPFGASWVARYHGLRKKAASFRMATHETDTSDDSVFSHGSEYAMGLALHQAALTSSHAIHVAAWDGAPATTQAGTAIDVARWAATGNAQTIVHFPAHLRAPTPQNMPSAAPSTTNPRTTKAMLFGDVRGFSKLNESHIRNFVEKLMRPLAEMVQSLPTQPDLVATWGDGIHFIYDTVEDAAEAALTAQERFASLELEAEGLPTYLALRIGGHVGPVSRIIDPFMNAPSFYGTQITLAARIEPVAVPGTVYVSEPFAALLALRARTRFRTDYAGQTELAKKFGTMRLFVLRRAEAN